MAVAATNTLAAPCAPGIYSTFDPDRFDVITEALLGAETITDLVAKRKELGPEPDRALQLEMDRNPVGAMARVMLARHAKGYETTQNTMLALGFSHAQIDAHGKEAMRQALAELGSAATDAKANPHADYTEQQALLESACCAHAEDEA